MRNMKLLIAGISAAILVTGCGVTQDGFSSNSLQKRKYTKGFYISKRSHLKAKEDNSKNEVLIEKNQAPEEVAVILKKREVKQTSGSEYTVVRQKEDVKTVAAENAESPKTTNETLAVKDASSAQGGSATVTTVSDNSSVRISRDQKKEVKTLFKKQKHESGSSGLADDLQILCIILCFFIPPLAVGIWTNIDWTKVLISLLLTLLFFIPGVIYSILVVLDKI